VAFTMRGAAARQASSSDVYCRVSAVAWIVGGRAAV
jgi:hypothetical protein